MEALLHIEKRIGPFVRRSDFKISGYAKFSSKYVSASTDHKPWCRAHISASEAKSGLLFPNDSKSDMAVSGMSMWL